MSKKRMLADVLWEAANVHLSPRALPMGIKGSACEFSCHAFNRALHGHKRDLNNQSAFLNGLGLEFYYNNCPEWSFDDDRQLQGVRYMWLLLAMHVAEDEGIEIECAA
jgi:hypothetical protein